jgi:sporulation protein YlmC with PRC-barrel domain
MNTKITREGAVGAAAFLLLATATTVSLSAQEPSTRTPPEARTQDPRVTSDQKQNYEGTDRWASTSKLIGAKVRMMPGVEARREAAEEGDAAKRPEGKIDELLTDCHTGEVQYAVVSFGGFIGIGDKTVLVSAKDLRWNQPTERFELSASEDQLKAMPDFDIATAEKHGFDSSTAYMNPARVGERDARAEEASGRDTRDARDASGTTDRKVERVMVEGTTFHLVPARLCRVTKLDDYPVYSGTEKWGKVTDLLVDRNENRISLAVVSHGTTLGMGGKDYLVPFTNLKTCVSGNDTVLCSPPAAATKLESSVIYEKPKTGVVDPAAAQRAMQNADPVRKDMDKDMDKDVHKDVRKNGDGRK